jgi:hypothetical protein
MILFKNVQSIVISATTNSTNSTNSTNTKMMFLSSKLQLLLFIVCVSAAPIEIYEPPMPDCPVCIGITVQIRRSPASLVICDDSAVSMCINITGDVIDTMKEGSMFNSMTPEDLCMAMGYCPENTPYNARIIDMLTAFDPIVLF